MANYVYSGVGTAVRIDNETSFGTGATPASGQGIGFVTSVNVTEKSNIMKAQAIGTRSTTALVTGPYDIDGTIESDLQTGRLLAYALGTDTVSGTYLHTLATANALTSAGLCVSHNLTNSIARIYSGVLFKGFRITGDLTSPLKCSADFSAKSVSVDNSTVTTYSNTTDMALAPCFGTLSLYGATVAQVQSLDFSLDNGISYVHAIGQRTATSSVVGPRTLDLKATFNFEDAEGIAEYKSFLADAASPYTPTEGDVTAGVGSITYTNAGVGAALRRLVINLSALKITDYSINTPVDGVVTADLNASVQDFTGTAVTYDDSYATNYITNA